MTRPTLSIGEFSRMTHLSAKALRFYHREGLLEPAGIDPVNGYREYTLEQLPTAQVIRRFRELDMPVDTVRAVLAAPDVAQRNLLIAEHLDRLESRLAETSSAVAALRNLLLHPSASAIPLAIERRSVAATPVLIISDTIDLAELGAWYTDAFHELDAAVAASGRPVRGARGGLWSTELFRDERGAVSVFRPVELPGLGGGGGGAAGEGGAAVRATGETATTNAVSRPTDETATADAVSRPADETATADPVSRPTDWSSGETAAADPVSRPTDGSSAHRVTARATTPADFIVGRVRAAILPPVELAIAVHTGPDAEVDRTYGALGAYVASNELSVDGPVRESYLVSEFDDPAAARVTEIGWPIFRTTP